MSIPKLHSFRPDNFYKYKSQYKELHELIDNTYQEGKLHTFSLGDRLEMSPKYTDLLERIGISYLSFRSNPTDTSLPLEIFFELAESKEVLSYNFRASKGVVIYPGGPPLDYWRRIVPNIGKAKYLNVSEATKTFRHISGDWYPYEQVQQ